MTQIAAFVRSRPTIPPVLLAAVLLLLLSGCAVLDRQGDKSSPADGETQSTRAQLNAGYSDLYSNASGLAKVDTLLYVKFESDDVERVVTEMTDYCAALAQRLEALAADYPALDLHQQVDPPIIKAARDAQKKANLKRFAPVVGDSGTAFERGLLIRLLGAADQQHYMAATLAEREPNPALSKIMAETGERFAGFYDEIDRLLKARFYR
ncbi:hypothetical protein S4A8_15004 [Salinisphaera sp. S4-8]|uniref:hypothetical protein n=1 Tax=Salinisphaera sp. S4-8 TaxID=633357 RepID=UPI00334150A4